jgi:hypothetical protein
MLSKALVAQIVARGYIVAFEIQGINDFYRRELEKEYSLIVLPAGSDANNLEVWFKLWGPQLLLFKRAIEIFCEHYEVMVIRNVDAFILNLIEQITSAQKNRKLNTVLLHNVQFPDVPPIVLHPNDATQPLPPMPFVEDDLLADFTVTMPLTEDSCFVSMESFIPDIEDANFIEATQLDITPLPLARSSSDSIATTRAPSSNRSSPDASPFSASPPCSPRNEELIELDRLEIRYVISVERCKKSLLDYNSLAHVVDNFFARTLLQGKIPHQQNKETLKQITNSKSNAYGTFLQDRNALATSIRFYNEEHLNVFGKKPAKQLLLSSKSLFTFKPNSVNGGNSIKRPEHQHAVAYLRKR